MLTALGVGIAGAGLVAVAERDRRRREIVARAAHEVRGALSSIRLTAGAAGIGIRQPAEPLRPRPVAAVAGRVAGIVPPPAPGDVRAGALDTEIERALRALADLDELARGRASVPRPGPRSRARADTAMAIDVDALVRSAAFAPSLAAARDGRPFELRLQAGDALVSGDRGRLNQALGNLLANALEHGKGSVRISTRVAESQVEIEIADDGPGFPGGAGVRAGRGRQGRRVGLRGHGVAIARDAIDDHGGCLAVVGDARGARVRLSLPLLPVHRR